MISKIPTLGRPKGDVASITKVFQLMETCDSHGGCKGVWEGVITIKRYDSPQGGEKVVRKVRQLMERCDAHWGM